jgi:hypothetical protein
VIRAVVAGDATSHRRCRGTNLLSSESNCQGLVFTCLRARSTLDARAAPAAISDRSTPSSITPAYSFRSTSRITRSTIWDPSSPSTSKAFSLSASSRSGDGRSVTRGWGCARREVVTRGDCRWPVVHQCRAACLRPVQCRRPIARRTFQLCSISSLVVRDCASAGDRMATREARQGVAA